MRLAILLFILFTSCSPTKDLFIASPLKNGHAHNDYEQNRPLYYALENGFTSIEIDVCSHLEKVKVAHDPEQLHLKPTIEELYLKPLKKIIDDNKGSVFKGSKTTLILMIDFKEDKTQLFHLLHNLLQKYQPYLKTLDQTPTAYKPLQILISGEPLLELMTSKKNKYFFLDGRIHHLEQELPAQLIPRISASYKDLFNWNGRGTIPLIELEKLKTLINASHQKGKTFRLWGTPDLPDLWTLFLDEGVDWINVDDYEGFRDFPKR